MRPVSIRLILFFWISSAAINAQDFSFAFFTDIHLSLNHEVGFKGFNQALDQAGGKMWIRDGRLPVTSQTDSLQLG